MITAQQANPQTKVRLPQQKTKGPSSYSAAISQARTNGRDYLVIMHYDAHDGIVWCEYEAGAGADAFALQDLIIY